MKIQNLQQGTPEWHQYRANHFNASDAAAMLGVSPYKSRNELLCELATGNAQEIDEATQKRFDLGHKFEALARPIAEEIIGDSLYPVTGAVDRLSASFDGITLDRQVIWEHKTLNATLAACTESSDLPVQYRVQMEHQLHVSGAEKCLFMASTWSPAHELINKIELWYYPDQALREKLLQGWEQFAIDLENYSVQTVQAPVLPAISKELITPIINVSGAISLKSNLEDFGFQLHTFIEGINKQPVDDQEFADAESAIKVLEKAETALTEAENQAMAQTVTVDDMRKTVAQLKETARQARLALEKQVKSRKEQIKLDIINDGKRQFQDHLAKLNSEIAPAKIKDVTPDFATAAKNKRTLSSLKEAVGVCLANAKIDANTQASKLRKNLGTFNELASEVKFLFADLSDLLHLDTSHFELVIATRKDAHQAALQKAEAAKRVQEEKVNEVNTQPTSIEQTEQRHLGDEALLAGSVQAQQGLPAERTLPSPAELVNFVAKGAGVSFDQALAWLAATNFQNFAVKAA